MQSASTFETSDGDAYFQRNHVPELKPYIRERLAGMLARLPFTPKKILEIACSAGQNLDFYQKETGAECHGFDISRQAIEHGSRAYPELKLTVASVIDMPYEDASFDCVVMGGCMYLQNPEDLFKFATETNRLVRTNGILVVQDYESPFPYRNTFKHSPGLYAYKTCFRNMFLWNPLYRLTEVHSYMIGENRFSPEVNENASYSILYKVDLNDPKAFLTNPFQQ